MIEQFHLKAMNEFIKQHGEQAFIDAVFWGAFSEHAFKYIHPVEEMRLTEGFETIQKAFINAYT